MASLMKTLMNDFHEYAMNEKILENFESAMMFEQFVSYANNCHQMSNEQIFGYMNNMLEMMSEKNSHMEDVFSTIEEIVDYYRS